MRKRLCLLFVLLLACCIGVVAQAETCYESLCKDLHRDFEYGFSMSVYEEYEPDEIVLRFNITGEYGEILLFGENEYGIYEVTYWETTYAEVFNTAAKYCAQWYAVSERVDDGYRFVMQMYASPLQDALVIDSYNEATACYKRFIKNNQIRNY